MRSPFVIVICMVIARFSLIKTGLLLCFLLPATAEALRILYQHNLHDAGFWLFLWLGPLLTLTAFGLLRELLFHRARAMWLEDGQLVFVPFGLPGTFTSIRYKVPVENVSSVKIGGIFISSTLFKTRGILVDRKDRGFNRPIGEAPAMYYSEPVEVVYARLRQVLGIKPEAVTKPAEARGALDSQTK